MGSIVEGPEAVSGVPLAVGGAWEGFGDPCRPGGRAVRRLRGWSYLFRAMSESYTTVRHFVLVIGILQAIRAGVSAALSPS